MFERLKNKTVIAMLLTSICTPLLAWLNGTIDGKSALIAGISGVISGVLGVLSPQPAIMHPKLKDALPDA